MQNGQLQHRVTIIPINKISSREINVSTVNFAKSLVGQENVNSALSLIQYDPYFDPVMKFVFGHTLICRDLNIAKQVSLTVENAAYSYITFSCNLFLKIFTEFNLSRLHINKYRKLTFTHPGFLLSSSLHI